MSSKIKYSEWNVVKIKQELVFRGARTSGRKADLIQRLVDYDRNQNFANVDVVLPPPVITSWPVESFISVTADDKQKLPKLRPSFIKEYFLYRGALVGSNKTKPLEKGRLLLEAKRVQACSYFINEDGVYFSGVVAAAMKKHVSYCYKIKVSFTGEICNSDCECPAGKGPHGTCKHIAAVLFMLLEFIEGGELKVQQSCTSQLQKFHHPRKNIIGCIKEAENLYDSLKFEDPRPPIYRNVAGYSDMVRSSIISYCASTSADICMRYLYKSASLTSAQQDHDYFTRPFVEYWVDDALKVTESEAKFIESATRDQSDCKLWHQERKWRITSSRFGDIVSATPKRNYVKLCESIYDSSAFSNPAVHHGNMYESVARKEYTRKFNTVISKPGFQIYVDKPFLGATPDGILPDAVVEIKCPYVGRYSKIAPGADFDFLVYDESGNITLKKNHKYYIQVQAQMHICQKRYCIFIVYTHRELFVQKIQQNENFFKNDVMPILEDFYENHWRPFIAKRISRC